MVTGDDLETRLALVTEGDLPRLLERLASRAQPLLDRMPTVPRMKALLSSTGGVCPRCGAPLEFNPWSPDRHRCSRCGGEAEGERHHAHWARAQHLWIAERAAHLAAVAAFTGEERFAERSRELLAAYRQLYFELPNRDNVLGPTHLFFSTYLESMWLTSILGAAQLLRLRDWLDPAETEAVSAIAEEAALLIGQFDEGMSNRQTWNAAALTAVAVWFGDDELAQSAVTGRTGLLGHLTDGFGADGMWFEGENYHLFAIRGLLVGLHWARAAGIELLAEESLAEALGRALMAPAATALPDLTFPARKDARFGVSLAHPAYLECWEAGFALLGESAPDELPVWLDLLYSKDGTTGAARDEGGHDAGSSSPRPAAAASTYDAYLHDAGEPARFRTERSDLSWWMLLAMEPSLPPALIPWSATSVVLPSQGLTILRQHQRYVSLECGDQGGGHGHPDRLHLTVHAGGVHWLADPGAGSYINRDLFWYRSTLAHNAPRLNGESEVSRETRCVAFEDKGDWGWMAGEVGPLRRSVIQGPDWIVDQLTVRPGAGESTTLELPWHFAGTLTVETNGRWVPDRLEDEFVSEVERFEPERDGSLVVKVNADSGETLTAWLMGGALLRAMGPGRPGEPRRPFLIQRAVGSGPRLVTVLDFSGAVTGVETVGDAVKVISPRGPTTVRSATAAATAATPAGEVTLGGARTSPAVPRPFLRDRPLRAEGQALRIDSAPVLDGSLDGFDLGAPLEMADELHYVQSEEPYPGPDALAAVGYVNWDHEHLYLAVDVVKDDLVVRASDGPPLELDNEPDDIHSDGIQVHYRIEGRESRGFLIRPTETGGLLARPIPGSSDELVELEGGSARTDQGYCVTVALPCPELRQMGDEQELAFELCVNEMRRDRLRRAGQLAWSGGGGWIYLRGDRTDPARWGRLELVG